MAKIQPLPPRGYSWHYSALHGNTVGCGAKEIRCQLALNNLDFPLLTLHCLDRGYTGLIFLLNKVLKNLMWGFVSSNYFWFWTWLQYLPLALPIRLRLRSVIRGGSKSTCPFQTTGLIHDSTAAGPPSFFTSLHLSPLIVAFIHIWPSCLPFLSLRRACASSLSIKRTSFEPFHLSAHRKRKKPTLWKTFFPQFSLPLNDAQPLVPLLG